MFYLTGYDTTGFHSFPQVMIFSIDNKRTLVTRQYEVENALKASYKLDAIGYDDSQGPAPAVASVVGYLGLAERRLGIEKNVPLMATFEKQIAATFTEGTRREDQDEKAYILESRDRNGDWRGSTVRACTIEKVFRCNSAH